MSPQELARRLDALRSRVDDLEKRADRSEIALLPEAMKDLLPEALEALRNSVEELQVAVEQLWERNLELEMAREVLEAERRQHQDLFELAPEAYLVTNTEGAIRHSNRSAAALLGVPVRALYGKPLRDFLPPEERGSFQSDLARLLEAEEPVERQIRLCPRDREAIRLAVRIGTVRNSRGEPIGLRWLLRVLDNGAARG